MRKKSQAQLGLNALLEGELVRRGERDGRAWYAVIDVVKTLVDAPAVADYWEHLKKREPSLAKVAETVDVTGADGATESVEAVDLVGLMRLVQAIPSTRAERLKVWLARTAVERLAEAENPELAVLRTRKLYEQRGYSRRWVDKRLRGVSARHELTGEWYKRGATESDQFRDLTNTLMQESFGMDVEGYRRHKNLFKTGENLRDHMSDLELALVALGETAAVELHRDRSSQGYEALVSDAKDAGEIVARTRAEIEGRLGHPVIASANHRGWWAGRRRANAAPVGPSSAIPGNATPHPGKAEHESVRRKTNPNAEGDATPGAGGKAVA